MEPLGVQHVQITGRTIVAAMAIGAAALLVLGVQPILLGNLVQRGLLDERGIGLVSMTEILGIATGAAIGPFRMRRRMRGKASLLLLLLIGVDLAIFVARSEWLIALQRGLAGLAAGCLMGAVSLILVNSRNPAKMSGILLAVAAVPQIIGAAFLPSLSGYLHGYLGFFYLAVFALLALMLSPRLPTDIGVVAHDTHLDTRISPMVIAIALSIFLHNCGAGAMWAYIERLASLRALSPATTGIAIAVSLAAQLSGVLIAGHLSERMPTKWPIATGLMAQLLAALVLLSAHQPVPFIIAVMMVGLLWTGLQPLQLMALIEADPSRRSALLMTPVTLSGASIGPLVASFAIRSSDVLPAFWAALAMLAAGAALFLLRLFLPDPQ